MCVKRVLFSQCFRRHGPIMLPCLEVLSYGAELNILLSQQYAGIDSLAIQWMANRSGHSYLRPHDHGERPQARGQITPGVTVYVLRERTAHQREIRFVDLSFAISHICPLDLTDPVKIVLVMKIREKQRFMIIFHLCSPFLFGGRGGVQISTAKIKLMSCEQLPGEMDMSRV